MNKYIWLIIIVILVIIISILYYLDNINVQGQIIPIIDNIYLSQIAINNISILDRCFNPAIFKYKGEIYYVYRIDIGGDARYPGKILSQFLPKYHSNIVIYNSKKNQVSQINTQNFQKIKGFIDPRVIKSHNILYLTVSEINNIVGKHRMYLIILDLTKLDTTIQPEKILLLDYNFRENIDQKNWMPLLFNNQLYLIYSLSPLIILLCDTHNGKCLPITNRVYKNLSPDLRGSSNVIKIKNLFLGIVHTRYGYIYTHKFFVLKHLLNFEIYAISDDFIIQKNNLVFIDKFTKENFKINGQYKRKIQFISGILEIDNILYITYGENDYSVKQFGIETHKILNLLKYNY